MSQRYLSQWYHWLESSGASTVRTLHFTTFSSNDDLLCFGTLEITDRDFGLWRQTWLFLILPPSIALATTCLSVTFTDHLHSTDPSSPPCPRLLVCSPLPLPSTLARTMMIPHWAPTIHDGYAYYGRPQKPRRLILVPHQVIAKISARALLTASSCG
jgi:hypothetical protein